MYQIGKIANTHGIKGEVKIYNLSDFNRFLVGEKIYCIIKDEKKYFTIERVRPQGPMFIVKFEEFNNINEVLYLKGLEVYSDKSIDDQLEEDDYHYDMLLDKEVYTDSDEYVGKVVSLIPVPQGHLLEIEKENHKKILVPFVSAFVVDVLEDRIIISPIEGLL